MVHCAAMAESEEGDDIFVMPGHARNSSRGVVPPLLSEQKTTVRRGPHGNRPDAGVRRGVELERVLKEVDDRFR
jgi:hypothetical protein